MFLMWLITNITISLSLSLSLSFHPSSSSLSLTGFFKTIWPPPHPRILTQALQLVVTHSLQLKHWELQVSLQLNPPNSIPHSPYQPYPIPFSVQYSHEYGMVPATYFYLSRLLLNVKYINLCPKPHHQSYHHMVHYPPLRPSVSSSFPLCLSFLSAAPCSLFHQIFYVYMCVCKRDDSILAVPQSLIICHFSNGSYVAPAQPLTQHLSLSLKHTRVPCVTSLHSDKQPA